MKNNPLTRVQQGVLAALRDQPDLVDLDALARHLGRHPNTLREHLATLIDAGLVVRHQAPSEGRGRPRWLYGAAGEAAVDDNAELAAALAWRLAHRSSDPGGEARAVGKRWARQLVDRHRLRRQTTARAGRTQVVQVLGDLGYAPVPDRAVDRVALTRCPLLQVAKEVPEVVCAVHLGLVEDLLAASGADPTRAELRPFAAPGCCRLRLLAQPAETSRTVQVDAAAVSTAAGPSR